MLNWEKSISKTTVTQTYHTVTNGGLGAKPQLLDTFLKKNAILMPLNHIMHVLEPLLI